MSETLSDLALAEAYIHAGELREALAALDAHLAAHPDEDQARRLRARLQMGMAQADDQALLRAALDDLERIAQPDADDHHWRSIILQRMGDSAGARTAMRHALMLRPRDERLAERLIALCLEAGDHEQAEHVLQAILRDDMPNRWRWLIWQGDIAARRGNDEAAAASYSAALDEMTLRLGNGSGNALIENMRAQTLIKRAAAHNLLRRFAAADADYAAAERIIPDDPMIPFQRGLILYAAGNASQTALRRALPMLRDALDAAVPALRDQMRDMLLDNPLYRPLAQALL